MPATSSEKTLFRTRLGGNATAMPDAYVDAIFDEAETDYAGYSRSVQVNAALYIGAQDLLANAAAQVDYDANESSEKRSQRFKHLESLVKLRRQLLDEALADTTSGVYGGVIRPIPTRKRDYPGA